MANYISISTCHATTCHVRHVVSASHVCDVSMLEAPEALARKQIRFEHSEQFEQIRKLAETRLPIDVALT